MDAKTLVTGAVEGLTALLTGNASGTVAMTLGDGNRTLHMQYQVAPDADREHLTGPEGTAIRDGHDFFVVDDDFRGTWRDHKPGAALIRMVDPHRITAIIRELLVVSNNTAEAAFHCWSHSGGDTRLDVTFPTHSGPALLRLEGSTPPRATVYDGPLQSKPGHLRI